MNPSNESKESWTSIYSIPPSVKYPYNPVDALADIPGISHALDLFLASHMLESEDYCNKSDEHKLSSIPFFLSYCSPRNSQGTTLFRNRVWIDPMCERLDVV